jgi:hypothetical protein
MLRAMSLSAMLAVSSAPALAEDRLIDIAQPAAVVAAMQEAGYKAVLKKSKEGESFIESAANGSPFTVQFYGCKDGKDCGSLQFHSWYKKKPLYTVALVNRWNTDKRFLKAFIDDDGDLSTTFDVTGVGKTTYANFADTIDWWSTMTGELFLFLEKAEAPAKGGSK